MKILSLWYYQLGYWHTSDEYEGIFREVTFRSLCHSPLCPPDTAVTEWQHALQSNDNTSLVCCLMLIYDHSIFLISFCNHLISFLNVFNSIFWFYRFLRLYRKLMMFLLVLTLRYLWFTGLILSIICFHLYSLCI